MAQDAPDLIKMWQASYPHVELVSQQTYQSFSEKEREILSSVPHIVFQDAISVDEINAYATDNGLLTIDYHTKEKSEENIIAKEWLKNHPEVKVVKRSDFNRMDTTQQEEIRSNISIMVLIGESISIEDINHFTTKK